jgi:F0F1-type ATP synthase assembly protein I
MSPARSRRTPIPHRRSRDEIVRAVGVGAAIVIVTAALIWLLRPGAPGSLGGGGLMSRQPRASGLVVGALVVAGFVTWWILRVSRRARGHEKVVLPIALGLVLVAAIVVGMAWPGGLLRQYPSIPKPITPTTTLPTSTTGATGVTGATGATGATSSSTTPNTGVTTTASP